MLSSLRSILLVFGLWLFIYHPPVVWAQTPQPTIIKVLLYNGYGDSGSSDYRRALDYCNTNQLIPGYQFSYSYSGSYLDQTDLANKDVVMYPGGYYNMGYSTYTNHDDVKEFVTSGGGYYGTCAGFGAALACLPSPYACGGDLINLLPPVKAIQNWYQGPIDLRLTSEGARILGYGGNHLVEVVYGLVSFLDPTVTLPAGLDNPQDLAYYDNNHSVDGHVRYSGLTPTPWKAQYDYGVNPTQYRDALIAHYGQGRVLVQHAHPEMGSTWGEQYWYPKWLCAGVTYAAGIDQPLPSYTIGYDRGRYTTYPYTDYLKTAWNTYLSPDNQARFDSTENNFIAHRVIVPEKGVVNTINVLHAGDSSQSGQIITGIYGGETEPTTILAQSLPTSISPTAGWQSFSLTTPLHLEKNQTIWLAVSFKGGVYSYYAYLYSSYLLPDSTGSWKRFEDRVWGGYIINQEPTLSLPSFPDKLLTHRTNTGSAPGGKTYAAMNSIYAEVYFDQATPTSSPPPNVFDFDLDGDVDYQDFLKFVPGFTNIFDLNYIIKSWGTY